MANLRVDKITSTETFETTGSVQFDGDGDRLSVADNADFGFGSGDFTIEYWIYHSQTGSRCHPFDLRASGAEDSVTAFYVSNTTELRIYFNGSDKMNLLTELQPSQWVHHALVRNGDILTFYQNGIRLDSAGVGGESLRTSAPAVIGAKRDGSEVLNGHISNFRVIKGQALYTANFKTPMRELEVVPDTVLLCCQSKTDASLEKTGKTITVTGNAVANELTPGLLTPIVKSGGGSAITGSVEFDGTSDYLSVQSSTDFDFGTGDFTIELYANLSNLTNRNIIARNDSNPSNTGILLWQNGSSQLQWYSSVGNTTGVITVTTPLTLHEWAHIAVSRESNTTRLFANGVLIGSVSDSTNISGNSALVTGSTFNGDGYYLKGFISNFRINKGTALYTADFIPPTRELKKVPGTVLLCCQDPDSPLTEATGKTITGYGDLQKTDDVELITNGSFAGDFTGWSNGNPSQFTYSTDSVGGDTSGKLKYVASDSNLRTFTQYVTCVTGQKYNLSFFASSNASNAMVIDIDGNNVVTIDNNSNANLARYNHIFTAGSASVRIRVESAAANTAYFDNFSVKLVDGSNKGSNFTPQVGDDRKVTFEGVTKIDTDAYFYLPTGDTASREATGTYNAGTRGLYSSFESPVLNTIEYLTIASLGSVENFGDLSNAKMNQVACSSDTRGLFASGYTPSPASGNNFIDFVTIMSTGNALDFGDLSFVTYVPNACSNQTRGIFAGGAAAPAYGGQTNMDYVTIASKGNGRDFGDLTQQRHSLSGVSSPTRGVFAAGNASPSSNLNNIDYITIASTGNAKDFGDLTLGRAGCAGASSAIRGLFAGGYTATPSVRNIIDFITIATTGNAQDFGDLTAVRRFPGGTSSSTRAVFMAGYNPSATNTIDFVSIQTTGNATDFGDTTINKAQADACSNGHGGLG